MTDIQESPSPVNTSTPAQAETQTTHEEINLYPTLRTLFLVMCVLFTIAVVLFLIYQNGKSIYETGI